MIRSEFHNPFRVVENRRFFVRGKKNPVNVTDLTEGQFYRQVDGYTSDNGSKVVVVGGKDQLEKLRDEAVDEARAEREAKREDEKKIK